MRSILVTLALATMAATAMQAKAAPTFGYADVVLDFFDSGAGPIPGPYGGTFPGNYPGDYPVPVPLDYVLGGDTTPLDFLSLPDGSYVTVGFTDEVILNGPGDDIFIQEIGGNGERAEVYISSDGVGFTLLGIAQDNITTSLDLAAIGYADQVTVIKIVGLDNFGGSPGFDVVNVQGLLGSIVQPPVADANGPYSWTLGMPTPVVLDGTGSSDPVGLPLDFTWDLDNDGVFDDDTGIMPSINDPWGYFGGEGVYNVALRVDNGTAWDVDQTTITLIVPEPATMSLLALGGLAFVCRRRR